jgi:hypothetical protein
MSSKNMHLMLISPESLESTATPMSLLGFACEFCVVLETTANPAVRTVAATTNFFCIHLNLF